MQSKTVQKGAVKMNMLTVQEVGERLGMSKNTAYKLVKNPGFPKIQIGRKYSTSARVMIFLWQILYHL